MKPLVTLGVVCTLLFPLHSRMSKADEKPANISAARTWKVGEPIVSYWAGPGYPGGVALNDSEAARLVEGGWNLVWAHEKELAVAHKHKLRALLTDPLLVPETMDDPSKLAALGVLVDRVKEHPALYAYHLVDEPSAKAFPALGKLVAFLRERDPKHLAYINVLPIYANNEQLGVKGSRVEAYREHLRLFVETVKPDLVSYDHYQFRRGDDGQEYFLNLAMIREAAQTRGIPFMNIVQASSWVPGSLASPDSPRVPVPEELRYLAYTTLAYGAQAISYYVYGYPAHDGGMIRYEEGGKKTTLYDAAKTLNREFVAIAKELQPLQSIGVYHGGMHPMGTNGLPANSSITFDPPIADLDYKPGDRVQGFLLGTFGKAGSTEASHCIVVNLDYKAEAVVGVKGQGSVEVFDAGTGEWKAAGSDRAELKLAGGEGKLLRVGK